MKATRSLILILVVNALRITFAAGESPNVIGSWNVDISFANQEHRSVHFEARGDGKGSLTVTDPKSKVWAPATASDAKWTQEEANSVTFSGPVEFLIGNVGRDAGILTCKGKFEAPNLITGEVDFSPMVGEQPSKQGTFRATRSGGEK